MIAIEKERKELLSLLSQKANLSYKDLVESAVETWIANNLDLLTEKGKTTF